MTRYEAEWLAASMLKEDWPEVWIEPGVFPDDWRVSYRRLPDEAPRHAVTLSKTIKARCERDRACTTKVPPVEVLTREEAAARGRLRPGLLPPVFRGKPLADGEMLHQTVLPCPRCEDDGHRTLGGETPRLCRRESGDLVCPAHGDAYAELENALNHRH